MAINGFEPLKKPFNWEGWKNRNDLQRVCVGSEIKAGEKRVGGSFLDPNWLHFKQPFSMSV